MTITAPTTIADTPLFDLGVGIDSPRARVTDPIASHLAADQSQSTIHEVRERILLLVKQEGAISGRDLNDLYRVRADRLQWKKVSYDSPRKRAAEMLEDGLLRSLNEDAKRGTGRLYALPVGA